MFLHETQSNGVLILILGNEISLCFRQMFVENFDKDELVQRDKKANNKITKQITNKKIKNEKTIRKQITDNK